MAAGATGIDESQMLASAAHTEGARGAWADNLSAKASAAPACGWRARPMSGPSPLPDCSPASARRGRPRGGAGSGPPRRGRRAAARFPPPPRPRANWRPSPRLGGRLLVCTEPDYPAGLAALEAPPPVLTVLGHTALLGRDMVAIVGARNASALGRKLAATPCRRSRRGRARRGLRHGARHRCRRP